MFPTLESERQIIQQIQTPVGKYTEYSIGEPNILFYQPLDSSWNYDNPRQLRMRNKARNIASHYPIEHLREMHQTILQLAPVFNDAVQNTMASLNGYMDKENVSENSEIPWKKSLARQLLPAFLEVHQDQFDLNAVDYLYKDDPSEFFTYLNSYMHYDVKFVDQDRFFISFASAGVRNIKAGYAAMIAEFGIFDSLQIELNAYYSDFKAIQHLLPVPISSLLIEQILDRGLTVKKLILSH